ncbi:MAG: hypothetical protein IT431_02485 [Phycisphaerales bacterium]|nr:hypothetical protein [Phycisphaerales bacterium]
MAAVWLLGLLGSPTLGQGVGAEGIDPNRRCFECHGQSHIAELDPLERLSMVGTWLDAETPPPEGWEEKQWELRGDEPERRTGLYIQTDALAGSAHAAVTCVECHTDAARLPHEPSLQLQTCATECHEAQASAYPTGSHYEALQNNDELAPTCASCHGGHQIKPVGDLQSEQHRLNSIFMCAECHEKHMKDTPGGYKPRSHIEAYFKSAHGRAVAESGLVNAPTCSDCHTAHAVHPVEHPDSPVHRDQIPQTCGRCHVGILKIYDTSIHGQLAAEGDPDAPVCTDCHTSHEIIHPDAVAFKLASGERCGACHEDRIKHYQETFHGKALALGRGSVAACFDCHGHHDIVGIDDEHSRLFGEKKLETCRQCHPSATAKFTGYLAHADHLNREHYPVLYWTFVIMTAIVVGTFLFFGAHTIMWFARSVLLLFRDRKRFMEIKRLAREDRETFIRFRPFERFLHVLVMTSFLLLVATGMPLKFYYTGWAKAVVNAIGGLEAAAQLHRLGAVVTFAYFALHIGSLLFAGVSGRERFRSPRTGRYSPVQFLKVFFGPDLPYPHIQDFRDWWAHQKWFFGKGPQPQFDKWTYWEKFDYLAVFWGVTVIGLSGLVMWFPEFFTRFMPGWTINVALIIHSDEALLAAGFIFAFHFFNVHFRPEKFPLDSVIFSGRISKAEMLHERRRWYDRLVATGRLDAIRVKDEWSQWRRVIHPLGYLAFGIGLALLALIVYAMGSRLIAGGH